MPDAPPGFPAPLCRGLAPVERPACPLLCVYGTHKPFMFHSAAWLAALQARPGWEVHALATGHGVMLQ